MFSSIEHVRIEINFNELNSVQAHSYRMLLHYGGCACVLVSETPVSFQISEHEREGHSHYFSLPSHSSPLIYVSAKTTFGRQYVCLVRKFERSSKTNLL